MSTKFKKIPATVRFAEEFMQRLVKVAQASRRPVSNVIELCVERGLPDFEREIEEFREFQNQRNQKYKSKKEKGTT
jgi:hypothetical protein